MKNKSRIVLETDVPEEVLRSMVEGVRECIIEKDGADYIVVIGEEDFPTPIIFKMRIVGRSVFPHKGSESPTMSFLDLCGIRYIQSRANSLPPAA